MKEKILEAIRLALEIGEHKKPGGPDVIALWSTSANRLAVHIYHHGLKSAQAPDSTFAIYADGTRCYQPDGNIDKCLTELRRALKDAGGTI